MKFLIFNLSVVTALAYLILGQDQLSDIGRTISEKGNVSLDKAITFLNTPHSKEVIEKTIKCDCFNPAITSHKTLTMAAHRLQRCDM